MSQHEEQHEQSKTVNWCLEQGLEPFATAQSTWTESWKSINQNKALGVRKGVSDLIIFIPTNRSVTGTAHVIFCEMKKIKGGYASKEQKHFLALAESVKGNVHAFIAHGFDEAKKFITPLIKPQKPVKPEDLEQFINNI